jgi:pSer/pThr/pTyr-binding forkhead associated (FHA) protein/type II secretory pathway predicted ATPase ExeA
MFIEQYKLDRNPFAEESVRPLFVSQSMREVSSFVRSVGEAKIQSLFITGAAGVGKTTLLSQRIRGFKDVSLSWVSPDVDSPQRLYQKLLHDLGPGSVEGSIEELRKILEVYLIHQRTNGRLSAIIVDGLERQRSEVLNEIRRFFPIRARHLPVLQFVFLTRNDELVDDLIAEHEGSGIARAKHARLIGFTLEETHSYLRICLQGAGCDWASELIPDSVVLDIQAFTQGVVGDINALCFDAFNELAKHTNDPAKTLRISSTLIKGVGARLHLRHNPDSWSRTIDETLSPDAVRVSDTANLKIESARLIVSSGGKQLAEVTLNRPRMILGRDPGCDISLDSTYLSRFQNLFMQTDGGWMIIDLNSTNGCFVNGRRVREHRLRDGDFIAVGHHQLRFASVIPRGDRIASMDEASEEVKAPPASPTDDTISTDISDERKQWSLQT